MVVRVAALGIAVHNQMLMSACEHVVKCEIASEWMLSTACELACERRTEQTYAEGAALPWALFFVWAFFSLSLGMHPVYSLFL